MYSLISVFDWDSRFPFLSLPEFLVVHGNVGQLESFLQLIVLRADLDTTYQRFTIIVELLGKEGGGGTQDRKGKGGSEGEKCTCRVKGCCGREKSKHNR